MRGRRSGRYRGDGGRVIDGPAAGDAAFDEVGGGVDGEGTGGDGEHGGVVDGVAEDGAGCGDADAVEGGYFAFVGGDVKEALGGDVVLHGDASCEDAVGGDVEALDAFFNDPIAGGADGPDVDAVLLEVGDELEHFGEDVALDVVGEEIGGGTAEFGLAESVVDLHHFAADG